MKRCSGECDARVAKLKLRLPPSALKPQASASASIRVDLPDPFSPTRKVTLGWNTNSSKWRTAGRLKGYAAASQPSRRSTRAAIQ